MERLQHASFSPSALRHRGAPGSFWALIQGDEPSCFFLSQRYQLSSTLRNSFVLFCCHIPKGSGSCAATVTGGTGERKHFSTRKQDGRVLVSQHTHPGAETGGWGAVPDRGQAQRLVVTPAADAVMALLFQDVFIQGNRIKLGTGFACLLSVPILFEETFYNEKEESFSILCIAHPLEKRESSGRLGENPSLLIQRDALVALPPDTALINIPSDILEPPRNLCDCLQSFFLELNQKVISRSSSCGSAGYEPDIISLRMWV